MASSETDLILSKLDNLEALLNQRVRGVEVRIEDHETRLRLVNDRVVALNTQSGLAHIGQTAFTLVVSVGAFVAIRLLGVK